MYYIRNEQLCLKYDLTLTPLAIVNLTYCVLELKCGRSNSGNKNFDNIFNVTKLSFKMSSSNFHMIFLNTVLLIITCCDELYTDNQTLKFMNRINKRQELNDF